MPPKKISKRKSKNEIDNFKTNKNYNLLKVKNNYLNVIGFSIFLLLEKLETPNTQCKQNTLSRRLGQHKLKSTLYIEDIVAENNKHRSQTNNMFCRG